MSFQDAGMREVFRGDLSAVQLAAGVLEEAGIETQLRWEMAGGAQFTVNETALIPGRVALLLVPSVAYDEATELLLLFEAPEADHPTELSPQIEANRNRRKSVAAVILILMLGPFLIAALRMLVELLRGIFG